MFMEKCEKNSGNLSTEQSRLACLLRPQSSANLTRPLEGQGLVEFALILPVLMLIIIGIMEFGLAYFDAGKTDYSAREVARGVAICGNACDLNEQLANGNATAFQYDLKDLALIANDGYVNAPAPSPTLINPSLVEYIWIQRVYDNGYAVPVTGTVGGTYKIDTTNNQIDYRPYFNYFIYDQNWGKSTDTNAVPFVFGTPNAAPDASHPTGSNGCQTDPWKSIAANEYNSVQGISGYPYSPASSCVYWPSVPSTSPGRGVCEPTNRFFVEVGYRHYWITPLIPSANGYIILKSRIYMKIEPRYFNNQNAQGAQSSC